MRARSGFLVGAGVACSTKDYGTGADCSLGTVMIDAEGRIAIHADGVEMGNGIGTALARRVSAHVGGVADAVTVAQVDVFDDLNLVTSGDPYSISQAEQDALAGALGGPSDSAAPAAVPASAAPPATVSMGQTIEQVEAIMGKPKDIAKLPTKTIYVYDGLKVVFVNGKVSDVQ